MTKLPLRLCALALLGSLAAGPSLAASSAASSASEGGSASVGSSSTSSQKSSASSTDKKVAAGDYKLIEVAAAAERPGMLRMRLQALADPSAEGEFFLYLPQIAVDQSRLAVGDLVAAHSRPYGLEFTNGSTRQAFFLLLEDEWHKELPSKAVLL